jgi:hypothetical protein
MKRNNVFFRKNPKILIAATFYGAIMEQLFMEEAELAAGEHILTKSVCGFAR